MSLSSGEAPAVSMSYVDLANGLMLRQPAQLYAYRFALDPAKQVQSLTLPSTSHGKREKGIFLIAPEGIRNVRAPCQGVVLQWGSIHLATVAPARSNRSGRRGNDLAWSAPRFSVHSP